jgi:hypothetical protein
MRKLYLSTPYGNSYYIHENGEIERRDGRAGPSETWRLLGIQHVKRRDFIPFEDLLAGNIPKALSFKNGTRNGLSATWIMEPLENGAIRGITGLGASSGARTENSRKITVHKRGKT